jgi:hypothetical protein
MKPSHRTTAASKITNADLFLYALYQLGGAGKYIDVEDVFMEMWRLAPARFSWRKYQQPNYKITSKAIVDIDQRGDGDLLLGDGNSRQLSARGVDWIEQRLKQFERIASGEGSAAPEHRPSQRLVVELSKSPVVQAFLDGADVELERGEVAMLLRCAPDAPRDVWRERLETLCSAARDADRRELLRFFDHLEKTKPDWFRRDQ